MGSDRLTDGPGADQYDCGDSTDTVTDFDEDEDTAEDNPKNVQPA